MEKVHCRKTLGTETQSSFQTVLDSSSEHPLVARIADRVWAAALPSVTDLSATPANWQEAILTLSYCISAYCHFTQVNQGTELPLHVKTL